MNMRSIRLHLKLFLLALLYSSTATATIVAEKTFAELISESETIVIGSVTEVYSHIGQDGLVYTDAVIEIEHYLNPTDQELYGSSVTVRTIGGRVGQTVSLVSGMPGFEEGQNVLVFLNYEVALSIFVVNGELQGKYTFDTRRRRVIENNLGADEFIAILLELQKKHLGIENEELGRLAPEVDDHQIVSLETQSPLALRSPKSCPCVTPTGFRWETPEADFRIDPSVPSQFIPSIIAAAETWNNVGSNFQFNLTPNPASVNVIRFGSNPGGDPALTSVNLDLTTGHLTQITMTFDDSIAWSTTGKFKTKDIQGVATHEFGHWLFLDDLTSRRCKKATMTASGGFLRSGKKLRSLTSADKDGIRFIYGPNPPALLADLTVSRVDLTPEFDVLFDITNEGCGPARLASEPPGFMTHEIVAIRASDEAELLGATGTDPLPLPPRTSTLPCPGDGCPTRSFPPIGSAPIDANFFNAPSFYRVFADTSNVVTESNESNNTGDSVVFDPTVNPPVSCPLTGSLPSDGTIPVSESPCVIAGPFDIQPGLTLTIDPGVIVKFDSDVQMDVFGTLIANGTAAQPIIFTSIRDDVGGDTNGDGAATSPAAQDWRWINISSGGVASFSHSTIRFGGGLEAQIIMTGGTLSLSNSRLTQGGSRNLSFVSGGNATLTDSEIDTATVGILFGPDSTLNISGSSIHDHTGFGIFGAFADQTLNLTNTDFQNNDRPLLLTLELDFTHSGNTASNNTINGIEMSGVTVTDRTWTNDTIPYVVQGAAVAAGTTLTIDSGVVVKMQSSFSQITVEGTLNTQGTSLEPVFFTSLKDDTVGGDTNNDSSLTSPAPGDWRNIRLLSSGSATLSHATIRFGSDNSFGGISMSGNTLILSDVHLTENLGSNLSVNNGAVTITSSEIDTSGTGISHVSGGTVTVSQSSIHDHTSFGAFAGAGVLMNAVNNWWGDSSGPFHPTLNPTGLGNAVSDNVDFIPFLTADPVGSLP